MIRYKTKAARHLTALAICSALLLSACGGNTDPITASPQPSGAPAGAKVVLDKESIAPTGGDTVVVYAKILGPDGNELKGYDVSWESSNPDVAKVLSASNLAPSASIFGAPATVGYYATVVIGDAGGSATLTASLSRADGSIYKQTLVISAIPKPTTPTTPTPPKTYTLSISPSGFTLAAGAAAQNATAVVARSDGANGIADLTNWTWKVDDTTNFKAVVASDGISSTIESAPGATPVAATGKLTACADTPAGDHLCANASLSRPQLPLPTVTFDKASLDVKPGRTAYVQATLTDQPGQTASLAPYATYTWSFDDSNLASAVFGANAGSGGVSASASALNAWTGSLWLTVTYPDGRYVSTSIPVSSSGPWSQISVGAGRSARAIVVDGDKSYLLSADTVSAYVERQLTAFGALEKIFSASIPPGAFNLFITEEKSRLVVELANGYLGSFPVGGANDMPLFSDFLCGAGAARRSYATTADTNLAGVSWCPDDPIANNYATGLGFGTIWKALPNPSDSIIGARVFPDGTYALATAGGSVTGGVMQPIGMEAFNSTISAGRFAGAVMPSAINPTASNAKFFASRVEPYVFAWQGSTLLSPSFLQLYAVPAKEIQADDTFVFSLHTLSRDLFSFSAGSMIAYDVGHPPSATATNVTRFSSTHSMVNGNAKARIGAVYNDGSVWVFDQP